MAGTAVVEPVRLLVCCTAAGCRASTIDKTSAAVARLYGKGLLTWVCAQHDPGGKQRAYTAPDIRKSLAYEACIKRLLAAKQLRPSELDDEEQTEETA